MDKLDQAIAAARAEITQAEAKMADLQASRDAIALRLSLLEEAARLRPLPNDAAAPSSAHPTAAEPPRRGGRQVGSISKEWKRILVDTAGMDDGSGVSYHDFFTVACRVIPGAKEHAVHDRIRKYRDKLGFMESIGDKFRIKKDVVARFAADLGKLTPVAGGSVAPTVTAPTEDSPTNDMT